MSDSEIYFRDGWREVAPSSDVIIEWMGSPAAEVAFTVDPSRFA